MTRRNRPVPPRLTFARGFTLTEIAIVLFIIALLIGGLMLPMAAQDDIRRTQETQRVLSEAREALAGFAAAQGRLPCPATVASKGIESYAVGGDAINGLCSNFYDGFLPAATLGLSPTNQDGLLLDGWNQPIRYAVWTGTVGSTSDPISRIDGIKTATMTEVAKASMLSVCSTITGITGTDCGTANSLTSTAPVIIFSVGKNGATSVGADEAANLNGDPVFVSHEPTSKDAANGEFDDIVVWLSPNILYNRMIAAGRLP